MRKIAYALLALAMAGMASAQQQPGSSHPGPGATTLTDPTNLPVEKIGNDDLIGITVYDSPELTRSVRVNSDGDIRLPMVHERVHVAGLYPVEVESAVSKVLVDEDVLVDPIVTVSVLEYRSRPITVVGSVKNPLEYQATGKETLLDAISKAGGLADNAGGEVLVTTDEAGADGKPSLNVRRIPMNRLLSGADPSLNLPLFGGEEIRVPEAGKIFVVGNVKKPCMYYISDGSESSVMKALAESEGLDSFPTSKAYIYRLDESGSRKEIPIELKKIMSRKTSDVALMASDILYVPTANGMKASMRTLESIAAMGGALGAAAIYVVH